MKIFDTDSVKEHNGELVYADVNDADMKKLYEEAAWMEKARPWVNMIDINTFVIVNPENGEKQLASVMGRAGQVFGLHLYQLDEGVRWFLKSQLQHSHLNLLTHEGIYDQRVIKLELLDISEVENYDIELEERYGSASMGVDFNKDIGGVSCVAMRNVVPGSPPWHVGEPEARRLLDGMHLLHRFHEKEMDEYDWAVFLPEFEGDELSVTLPTFTLPESKRDSNKRDDASEWELTMEKWVLPGAKELQAVPDDELFIARVKEHGLESSEVWEVGAVFLPSSVVSEGKPCYGVAGIMAVVSNGMAGGLTVEPSANCRYTLIRRVIEKSANSLGYLPGEIRVGSPVAEGALASMGEKLNIKITPVHDPEGMEVFNEVVSSLLELPMFSE